MKVPDRLYLSHLIYDTFQYQIHDPDDDTEIEYVHKDAFVEKVAPGMDNEIKNFENYIKGEQLWKIIRKSTKWLLKVFKRY